MRIPLTRRTTGRPWRVRTTSSPLSARRTSSLSCSLASIPIPTRPSAEERRRVLEEVWQAGRAAATPGTSAARSQDFLYE
jgi:hypothetical protein